MAEEKMVERIYQAVALVVREYPTPSYIFIFRHARISPESQIYDIENSYPWSVLVTGKWVRVIGTMKPIQKISESLQNALGKDAREIYKVSVQSMSDSFVQNLLEIVKQRQQDFPIDLSRINIPNILITEGKVFKLSNQVSVVSRKSKVT